MIETRTKAIQILTFLAITVTCARGIRTYTKDDLVKLREEVREMFYHAYNSYLKYAYPYDELRPISCDGIDTYGSYSLTLIDALGTLAIMGNYSEFQRVVDILTTKPDFDANINVSVFETNIRIVGGLLSAHLLSNKAGVKLEPGWPCNGPLLRLAEDVAKRLIVAFDTRTGMPYGTINLRHGIPKGETAVTCTAGIGTFILEFGTLSRLTGDPLYEEVAMNALYLLYSHKSQLGLYGNHIDVETGKWTYQDAGIGSGVDSFFEYLVKGSILLQRPELLEMFHEARRSIDKYLKKDDWYMWVSMTKGQVTIPVFQSLEAYWPGVLSLIGDTSAAMKSLHNYHQVWLQYGFTPEFYYIPQTEAGLNRESYPLRPELIESIMYLYRATGDPYLLQAGEDILRSIQHSARTPCGYATIRDVRDHRKEDRMESFFLSETTKYLYLLFDTENFIHNQGQYGTVISTPNGECIVDAGGYVFNTEAHPIDPGALHCCHDMPKQRLFDFTELQSKRSIFQGETIDERRTYVNKNNCTELEDEVEPPAENNTSPKNGNVCVAPEESAEGVGAVEEITTESSISYVKLEDSENVSAKVNSSDDTLFREKVEEKLGATRLRKPKEVATERKFDVQVMLERFRKESKYVKNATWETNYRLLSCKAQPFLQRISILGEFFKNK